MRTALLVVVLVVVLAACTTRSEIVRCANQPPSGPESLCPTSGEAHVEVTGNRRATFEAPLFVEGSSSMMSLELGVLQLGFRNASNDQFTFAGARTTLGDQHVTSVIVGVEGALYTSSEGGSECTVTLTSVDRTRISGSFVCEAIAPVGLSGRADSLTIDATGTFVASS